jgi:FRG domain
MVMRARKTKHVAKSPIGSAPANARLIRLEIDSWSEFVDVIEGADPPGFRNWCFRGQRDATWQLRPTLSRHIEVSGVSDKMWEEQERRIRRIFERKSHLFLADTPKDDEFEWLALMQHHGAPTRLLDFTWSPYVAAFFALEKAKEDAAIWGIDLGLLWQIHEQYVVDGVSVPEANPRHPGAFHKYYLPNRHAFVWVGDPFRMAQRVVAQSGTFLVSSHLGMTVEEVLARYPGSGPLLVQFVLRTSKVREEAMASLYSMNITQATLFPGLDGLARSMAYEFEYSWQADLATGEPLTSVTDPQLPETVLRLMREGRPPEEDRD